MKADWLALDSNVSISALFSPTGTVRQVVISLLEPGVEILMSGATFAELV